MNELPQHYKVEATAANTGKVIVQCETLQPIETDTPREFGGPGDSWSPETMLAAAVAGCFILTFRAIARASSLAWQNLTCTVDGRLDRAEGALRFIEFTVRATLAISAGGDRGKAQRLLEKAEHGCLISN
jgi:organic hydroperoxide reductase OsmC/OhrA